jgi:hypothetical protein
MVTSLLLVGWVGVVFAGLKTRWLSVHMLEVIALGVFLCGYFLQDRYRNFLFPILIICISTVAGLGIHYAHIYWFHWDRYLDLHWMQQAAAHFLTVCFVVAYVYLALRPVRRVAIGDQPST